MEPVECDVLHERRLFVTVNLPADDFAYGFFFCYKNRRTFEIDIPEYGGAGRQNKRFRFCGEEQRRQEQQNQKKEFFHHYYFPEIVIHSHINTVRYAAKTQKSNIFG